MAKLAGLPEGVINKAKQYLKELNASAVNLRALPQGESLVPDGEQISLSDVGSDEVRERLEKLDLNTITPLEAMNLLFELQRLARG